MARKTTTFRVAIRPGQDPAMPDMDEGWPQDLSETAKAHGRTTIEHSFRVVKLPF